MKIEIPPDQAPILAEVHELPVKKYRLTDNGRVLSEERSYKCMHRRFTIDDRLGHVECRDCKEKLNPMHALTMLARQETQYHELHERYQDELKRLAERSKTKCEHCQKMTRISKS